MWLSTLGILRRYSGAVDPGTIARELWNKDRLNHDVEKLYNISEFRAVTNRAADAYYLAGQINQSGEAAVDASAYHQDPTIREGEGQYSYRVVVEVTEGGHRVADGAVTVFSNMPLSMGEIRDMAVETILSDRAERDYRNSVGAAINMNTQTNVYVIAAGRA